MVSLLSSIGGGETKSSAFGDCSLDKASLFEDRGGKCVSSDGKEEGDDGGSSSGVSFGSAVGTDGIGAAGVLREDGVGGCSWEVSFSPVANNDGVSVSLEGRLEADMGGSSLETFSAFGPVVGTDGTGASGVLGEDEVGGCSWEVHFSAATNDDVVSVSSNGRLEADVGGGSSLEVSSFGPVVGPSVTGRQGEDKGCSKEVSSSIEED